MRHDPNWWDTLNPYTETTIDEVVGLIKSHRIDYSVCFCDDGLASSRSECEVVNSFFNVGKSEIVNRFSEFTDATEHEKLFLTPAFKNFYQEENPPSKNILIWFATHFDEDRFVIENPGPSSCDLSSMFFYLQKLGFMGYGNIFIFLNVCYSKLFSKRLKNDFVDMKGGMTIAMSNRHFFMHKNIIPIRDAENAAQIAVSGGSPESILSASERARNAVRGALAGNRHHSLDTDHLIEYVYIPNPRHVENR